MQVVDAAAARAALPFERLIPALRAMFASGCTVPQRHVHEVVSPGGERFTSLIMPAWLEGRYYGIKTINIAPGNAARSLPGLHASYLLFDGVSGVPLAVIDGDQITTRRTAAASALAASWLARADASHLLVVGAGQVASLLPEAYRCVRPIARISIWARDLARAAALVDTLGRRGIAAEVALDLAAAAGQADIVSCATLATAPLIQGRWLRPGSHLDLIGSFTPAMREADDDCLVGAALYLDTGEALQKSGDLIGPLSRGVLRGSAVRGTLGQLARGETTGRRTSAERTVFKSVGTALEDLAAAILVVEARGGCGGQARGQAPGPVLE
jgi:ornithine cyclodeaminase